MKIIYFAIFAFICTQTVYADDDLLKTTEALKKTDEAVRILLDDTLSVKERIRIYRQRIEATMEKTKPAAGEGSSDDQLLRPESEHDRF